MSYLKHKPGSIEEMMANQAKKLNDNAYQDMFKKELDKAGKGIGSMSPKEKKDFFNKIDSKYKAKSEDLDNKDKSVVKDVVGALKKATKAHAGQAKDLEKAMKEARFEVEGRVDYKGVSGGDDFSIVVDAPNEKAAEDKVSDMLFKHRDQKKIGPRGGRGVDDYEIESVERTSKSVTNKFSTYHAAEKDPSIKEADQHGDEINDKKHDGMKKGEKETKKIADSGSKLTKVETEPKVDYKN